MIILGIDIGNGSAVCCPLDHDPIEPRQFNIDGANFLTFNANVEGINGIIAIGADVAILEPTGTNYSKLWCNHLANAGVEVRLVDHSRLSAHRRSLDLPDKEDESDAFALAHYGLVNLSNPRKFLTIRDEKTALLRRDILRLQHLNRVQSPIICRLRQDLAWQFPEISRRKIARQGNVPPLILRWLAGESVSKRLDKEYRNSMGLGLTEEVRNHAARLCEIHREEIVIEGRMIEAIARPEYAELRTVLTAFGIGNRTAAAIISQVHPFDGYLDVNGAPIVQITKGKKSKKPTKKHLSRRRFEKSLGCAPTREASGKKDRKQVIGGSDLCRKLLWLWIFSGCSVAKIRSNNPVMELIYRWMSHPSRKGKPTRLLRMNACSHAARLLFKTLISLRTGNNPQLLHYEPDEFNHCSFCGDDLSLDRCIRCDGLKVRLDAWFKATK
jgi:transposase